MRETQKEKIFNYMRKKGYITTRDAGLRCNVWDLQSVIKCMKEDGTRIFDKWIVKKDCKFKVYALNKKGLELWR